MKALLEKYKKILKSFDFSWNDDGVVIDGDEEVTVNNRKLVLPYKHNVNSLVDVIEGKIVQTKELFNPFYYSVLSKKNNSIEILKRKGSINLSFALSNLVLAILEGALNKKKVNVAVLDYYKSLEDIKRQNMKTVIDKKVIKLAIDLFKESINEEKPSIVKLYTNRNIKLNGEKYQEGLIVDYPLLEWLKDSKNEISERRKDKEILIKLLEIVTKDFQDIISVSNSDKFPLAYTLLDGYAKFANHINKELYKFKVIITEDKMRDMLINIEYDLNKIRNIEDKLYRELDMLPKSDKDMESYAGIKDSLIETDNDYEFKKPSINNVDIKDANESKMNNVINNLNNMIDDLKVRENSNNNNDTNDVDDYLNNLFGNNEPLSPYDPNYMAKKQAMEQNNVYPQNNQFTNRNNNIYGQPQQQVQQPYGQPQQPIHQPMTQQPYGQPQQPIYGNMNPNPYNRGMQQNPYGSPYGSSNPYSGNQAPQQTSYGNPYGNPNMNTHTYVNPYANAQMNNHFQGFNQNMNPNYDPRDPRFSQPINMKVKKPMFS